MSNKQIEIGYCNTYIFLESTQFFMFLYKSNYVVHRNNRKIELVNTKFFKMQLCRMKK